ncbi:MAG TPA: hypothetical protein VHI13_01705 [Candidatus Kapabacteria bacterium]|nr:hypothetical protein [Candidatus Kapabacteria bacterium]
MDNSNSRTPALTFTSQVTPSVTMVTKVYGAALDIAVVEVHIKDITAWVSELMPVAPRAMLAQSLIYQGVIVERGATFQLAVPTGRQQGSVTFTGTITDPPNPAEPIDMAIASWNLPNA